MPFYSRPNPKTPDRYILNYIIGYLKDNFTYYNDLHECHGYIDMTGNYNQFKWILTYKSKDNKIKDELKVELLEKLDALEESLKIFNARNTINAIKRFKNGNREIDVVFSCIINKEIVRNLIVIGRAEGKISKAFN